MCNSHATATPFPAPRIPRTHLAVARGCGTLCNRRAPGDVASYDPRDCSCPACAASDSTGDYYCSCAVIHSMSEVARNTCVLCGGRIE